MRRAERSRGVIWMPKNTGIDRVASGRFAWFRFARLNYARSPGRNRRSRAASPAESRIGPRPLRQVRQSPLALDGLNRGSRLVDRSEFRRCDHDPLGGLHAHRDRDFRGVERGSSRDVVVKRDLWRTNSFDGCSKRRETIHRVAVWRFTFVDAAWLRWHRNPSPGRGRRNHASTIEPKLGSDVGLVLRGGSLSWPMRYRGMPLAHSAGLFGH